MPDTDSLREAALAYARAGFHVIPVHWITPDGGCSCNRGGACPTPGKHPWHNKDWPDKGSTSGADIWAWWEELPHANVGIVTGEVSGTWVLDIDPDKGGVTGLQSLCSEYGDLPGTRIHGTGSGGLHFLFANPAGLRIPNTADALGRGIDTRGHRGMVVAPPSVTAKGPYILIADAPLSQGPAWLLERLGEIQARREGNRDTPVVAGVPLDVSVLPNRVRNRLADLDAADRSAHFHGTVAACRRAGLSQAQTVTALGAWCAAVNKYVGRVEAEVARSWGKLDDADPSVSPEAWMESLAYAPAGAEVTLAQRWNVEDLEEDPDLSEMVRDLLLRRRAKEIVVEIDEARSRRAESDSATLKELLTRPRDMDWRVEGFLPAGGRLLLSAQRKTGKTTMVGNLARSLLTGEPMLGRFPVAPVLGKVIVLNYEVTGEQFADWMHDIGVPEDRMYVVNLRGRRNLLADAIGRERLVDLIREQEGEVLVVDPFGRAYTGASQDDAAQVTPWLVRLDEVAEAAGIKELILAAHAGWNGERTRGSSALEDWPDVIATMTRDPDTDERFLKVEGRDVDIEEDRLSFDPSTRTLRLSGEGSRKAYTASRHMSDLADEVVKIVARCPWINGSKVGKMLRDLGVPHQKGDERKALHLAVDDGRLATRPGRQGAIEYEVNKQPAPGAPDLPHGAPLRPTPPPYKGWGRDGQVAEISDRGRLHVVEDGGA